jgi:hypothetical protein
LITGPPARELWRKALDVGQELARAHRHAVTPGERRIEVAIGKKRDRIHRRVWVSTGAL